MPTDDDIRRESEAIARLHSALVTIEADLGWYWHWADGEGGYVLDLLQQAVRRRGYIWPGDARGGSRAPKKDKISRKLSRQVMERDEYRCVTCGTHIDLCCDHVVPESKGGPTTFDNLQTMCRPCNSRKGNRA
jgi:5-methylcytosine-specific restriction endonuclease McrA